ncbi:MAG: tRNA (adenosine(37)-N6)-threonylcarbamoyltransferase complex dimerization subunit type 1 TsaB [Candidatus Omnitrophota bacterium]
MKVLGFDTTTKFLAAALTDGGNVISRVHDEVNMGHSSLLIPVIDGMLKKSGMSLKDLGGIAVSIGPGSFTGLRIAVAACKAFGLAAGIPVVTVPTLDVIAYNYRHEGGYIAPVIDAKKRRVYSAFYRCAGGGMEKISDDLLTDVDGFLALVKHPTAVFGDGADLYGGRMKENGKITVSGNGDWYPRGETVARMGLAKLESGIAEDIDKIEPAYIYPKECNVIGFKYGEE